jgi:hypothetical protein
MDIMDPSSIRVKDMQDMRPLRAQGCRVYLPWCGGRPELNPVLQEENPDNPVFLLWAITSASIEPLLLSKSQHFSLQRAATSI